MASAEWKPLILIIHAFLDALIGKTGCKEEMGGCKDMNIQTNIHKYEYLTVSLSIEYLGTGVIVQHAKSQQQWQHPI